MRVVEYYDTTQHVAAFVPGLQVKFGRFPLAWLKCLTALLCLDEPAPSLQLLLKELDGIAGSIVVSTLFHIVQSLNHCKVIKLLYTQTFIELCRDEYLILQ